MWLFASSVRLPEEIQLVLVTPARLYPTLDLKFFVHHGDYIVQEVSGIRELVGSDVNLIHRLMKNHMLRRTPDGALIHPVHKPGIPTYGCTS
jgi:hypothetical protein